MGGALDKAIDVEATPCFAVSAGSRCLKLGRSRRDKHLQFVPTNLHSQRMEVVSSDNTSEPHFLLLTVPDAFEQWRALRLLPGEARIYEQSGSFSIALATLSVFGLKCHIMTRP